MARTLLSHHIHPLRLGRFGHRKVIWTNGAPNGRLSVYGVVADFFVFVAINHSFKRDSNFNFDLDFDSTSAVQKANGCTRRRRHISSPSSSRKSSPGIEFAEYRTHGSLENIELVEIGTSDPDRSARMCEAKDLGTERE
ncbi:hypothetical protein D9619_009145 [Psilocybe cf. subviscida]|uniref:Uncharacterized protein n=1 Tax=Psilocybe cf. subviscida TaxID=2480587 RepID=A0A8H5FA47_9AGAR|nr:hypothetical protein D9619_009145 [Psilocybe cf. subviscida]